MTDRLKSKMLLGAIIFLSFALRLQNINWDEGFHLHPDERFLSMVAASMKTPATFIDYLNPAVSTFNPAVVGFKFFVYGVFPVTLVKIAAIFLHADIYGQLVLVGRILSAVADIFVVIVIFKIVEFFEKEYGWSARIKYYGAFLYALSVLPIQLSHFFAVDTFLNLFMLVSFYFSLRFSKDTAWKWLFLSAFFFGLAVSSKITAFFIFPLNLFLILMTNLVRSHQVGHVARKVVTLIFLYGFTFYTVVRIADPHLFQSVLFLDPTPSSLFMENLKELKSFEGADIWFPPSVQWIAKMPVLYSLKNLALWGLGPIQFIITIIGMTVIVKRETWNVKHKKENLLLVVILLWVWGYFLYQGAQFSQNMRYFLPLYPFFAIFAALGLNKIFNSQLSTLNSSVSRFTFYVLLFVWPLAFISIYLRPHSRIAASEWIYQNVPADSVILSEHWDDALPLALKGQTGKFVQKELPVFAPDIDEKWKEMNALFEEGDYYVLSSNRAWGSISTVPWKYPKQTKFYEDLFAGRTSYKKVAEFTSYPQICLPAPRSLGEVGFHVSCFTFQDSSADESFTVYDHPKVMIFKKVVQNEKE